MSIAASNWAWSQPLANARHKLLLLKLADSANDEGVCWPSLRKMAVHTGISKSALSRATHALRDAGLIEIKETTRQDGRRGNNVYILAMGETPDLGSVGVPQMRYELVPLKVGAASPAQGRDAKSSGEPSRNRQNPAAASAAAAPEHVELRKWKVVSSREGKGPFVADLEVMRCTCENRSTTPCRHVRAALLAEDRMLRAEKRERRDAVWNVLVEVFGEPNKKQKPVYGMACGEIVEHLDRTGKESTPENWAREVMLRYRALVRDWGVGKVTLHSFARNFYLAGKLLSESPATTPRQRKYTAASEVE